MLFSVLYELLLWLAFILALPKAFYECIRYKKHLSNFPKRLGFGFPKIRRKGKGPIIWIHSVSVGECQAVAALIKRFQAEMCEPTIVVSSVSETGHAEAKKTLHTADYHVYLPFDFYLCVTHVLNRCTPDFVILSEGDFWYRFLKEAKRRGAVEIVVNGKISEKSEKSFKFFSFFAKRLFSLLDMMFVQSELYEKRFLNIGVAASKMKVTGNLKCDSLPAILPEAEIDQLREKFHLRTQDKVVVIGSTHNPEEELILSQLAPLAKKFPNLKLIIAPRHPERFAEVEELIKKHGLSLGTWTKGASSPNPQAFLIDAMGILRKSYQLANIAIVAGSFTNKIGGHNIMEPQVFGIPVIAGPYMYSQPQLIECARYYNAILQVGESEIGTAVSRLLSEPKYAESFGKSALTMVSALRGATDRTMNEIVKLVPEFFACVKQA
jgi:3-deoxy-D-manno-octulosonic-acid transferase